MIDHPEYVKNMDKTNNSQEVSEYKATLVEWMYWNKSAVWDRLNEKYGDMWQLNPYLNWNANNMC